MFVCACVCVHACARVGGAVYTCLCVCVCAQKPEEPTPTTPLLRDGQSKLVTEHIPSYARAPQAPARDVPPLSARQHRPDAAVEKDFRE